MYSLTFANRLPELLIIVLYSQFKITRGIAAFGSSSSPAKPGTRGMIMITLKSYWACIEVITLSAIASITLFFTTPPYLVAEMKNWF